MRVLREIEIKKRSERTIHIVIFLFFFFNLLYRKYNKFISVSMNKSSN